MNTYFDKSGRLIVSGATIVNTNGDCKVVYRTQNGNGAEDLGILATNPDFAKRHPDWPEEYYGLGAIDLNEWELEVMSYADIVAEFRKFHRENGNEAKHPCTAHVVFTKDSFEQEYDIFSRTYVFGGDEKAFLVNMGGYSIYASCIDGSDSAVRLERYMAAERGGPDGWKIEYAYLVKHV